MRKMLTVKELQFLDAALKYLTGANANAEYHPQIIIKDDNLILSGDFFIYSGYHAKINCFDCFAGLCEIEKKIISYETHIKKPIDDFLGQCCLEKMNFLLNNLDIASTMLLTEEYLELAPSIDKDVPPYIYSPTFYNAQIPSLGFYLLDDSENKTYEVMSIINCAKKSD